MGTDSDIEKELTSVTPSEEITKPSYIEVNYTFFGSAFEIQLHIFKGGTAKEFLRFLNELNNTKAKLGYTNYQK